MYILRFEVKQHVSALYGHHQVFSFKVSLYKLREKGCDVEISHQIIILVCLYIGGCYITLIYIYFFFLSFGRGGFHPGGVSWMSTSLKEMCAVFMC